MKILTHHSYRVTSLLSGRHLVQFTGSQDLVAGVEKRAIAEVIMPQEEWRRRVESSAWNTGNRIERDDGATGTVTFQEVDVALASGHWLVLFDANKNQSPYWEDVTCHSIAPKI